MLKLPRNKKIRWLFSGGALLGLVVVLQAPDDRATGRNSAGPAILSSAGIEGEVSGSEARTGPDPRPRAISVDSGRKAAARDITPDPVRASELSSAAASLPAEESYLAADTTDPAMATDDAEIETVNVGEYIDPEDTVTDADNTVVLIGEYLDPDVDLPGG